MKAASKGLIDDDDGSGGIQQEEEEEEEEEEARADNSKVCQPPCVTDKNRKFVPVFERYFRV